MLNIYPANRLENLVLLLDRVMQTDSDSNILSEEIILVQSKGMQHWLNLQLAQSRGISMNLSFSLPMQFFWTQIRTILGRDKVPEQSAYTREVLSWRLYALLASDDVIYNPVCHEATAYWLKNHQSDSDRQASAAADKRFQLACQIADLFEQYLIFRPDWLLDWEQGRREEGGWQAVLWQLLVAQNAQHPIHLLQQAMKRLKQGHCHLPARISLFGINTLPPLWLEFLSELGEQTQVHFFHLNPCVEYWGDLKTAKASAREQFYHWLEHQDLPSAESSSAEDIAQWSQTNPLLANLGTQGKDFLYLLQEHTSLEIPVFESPLSESPQQRTQNSVLHRVQNDILNLYDAAAEPQDIIDDSICLVSAHSALREIQALHDWLLHQINNDATLTPKDILVMCPNVENYAPYVDAVFAHGWNDWSEQVPPLPCSIADRTLKDSEPLVQAFIDLLDLPDSRFQVSQILSYLRLPAVQQKFNFSEDDLLILERWLNHAAIHWGLDAEHKQQILLTDSEQSNNKFSWQQGLERLLLGFAYGDQPSLYDNRLLLPDVEGDEALLLGRYLQLLEQLQWCARELQIPRSPAQWQQFLQQTRDSLFSNLDDDSNAWQIIAQAIDDLGEYTSDAVFAEQIPLPVIRDFLLSHFNQPEPGRQFMAGQVTFCSMVPMRSVPFRIIAVLGLNDGEFPRQRQPMGFDLMAQSVPRKGDRSRRGDDRYLFLEALISCRDKLYLSYQGHDIKTNNIREPSLVLQELMNYLHRAYGWDISSTQAEQLFKVPLQAFSEDNYTGKWPGYNASWLKLSKPGKARNNLHKVSPDDSAADTPVVVSAEQLVRFFDNPAREFARQNLGLYLEHNESMVPDDNEPFISDHLDRYLVQDKIIRSLLTEENNDAGMADLMQSFSLSGHLPDTPDAERDLLEWQQQAVEFADHIRQRISAQGGEGLQTRTVSLVIDNIQLEADLNMLDHNLLYWRLASPKGKDDIRLWIHHLLAQLTLTDNITSEGIFRGKKTATSDDYVILNVRFEPLDADTARDLLIQLVRQWQEGMQQPLLLNAGLGQKHCYMKASARKPAAAVPLNDFTFAAFWHDSFQQQGLGSDPYINWFWGDSAEIPQWQNGWQEKIETVYAPLYQNRQESRDD